MSDERRIEIAADELDWDAAEVQEGRQPAVVISVRFGSTEAARLRAHADAAGLTVSQIVRKALAEYEARAEEASKRKVFVSAFTYGGTMPLVHEQGWRWTGFEQTLFAGGGLAPSAAAASTTTEPTRVTERVTVEA